MVKAPDRSLQKRAGSLAEERPLPTPKEFGRVDVNGSVLIATEKEISFNDQTLATASITGIRFGIYKHYVNGIRTSQSYCIWVGGENKVIQIECVNIGSFKVSRDQSLRRGAQTAHTPA